MEPSPFARRGQVIARLIDADGRRDRELELQVLEGAVRRGERAGDHRGHVEADALPVCDERQVHVLQHDSAGFLDLREVEGQAPDALGRALEDIEQRRVGARRQKPDDQCSSSKGGRLPALRESRHSHSDFLHPAPRCVAHRHVAVRQPRRGPAERKSGPNEKREGRPALDARSPSRSTITNARGVPLSKAYQFPARCGVTREFRGRSKSAQNGKILFPRGAQPRRLKREASEPEPTQAAAVSGETCRVAEPPGTRCVAPTPQKKGAVPEEPAPIMAAPHRF